MIMAARTAAATRVPAKHLALTALARHIAQFVKNIHLWMKQNVSACVSQITVSWTAATTRESAIPLASGVMAQDRTSAPSVETMLSITPNKAVVYVKKIGQGRSSAMHILAHATGHVTPIWDAMGPPPGIASVVLGMQPEMIEDFASATSIGLERNASSTLDLVRGIVEAVLARIRSASLATTTLIWLRFRWMARARTTDGINSIASAFVMKASPETNAKSTPANATQYAITGATDR
jgi:hypothetical protein